MKTNNNGIFAAIGIAVAALFGISILPPRSTPPAATGSAAPKPASVERSSTTARQLEAPCQAIESRIRPFLPPGAEYAPAGCFLQSDKPVQWTSYRPGTDPHLQFLIATLPDPVHTHFSVEFDRLINALQQAAQEQGFVYDSSWLPWLEEPPQYSGLQDQDEANRRLRAREAQPGILVFRGATAASSGPNSAPPLAAPYQRGLLMFIVGETPTGGLNTAQFENAMAWMNALRPSGTRQSLGIVGPFFSGSLQSLAHLLGTSEPAQSCKPNQPSTCPYPKTAGFVSINNQSLQPTAAAHAPGRSGAQDRETTPPDKLLIFSGTTTSQPEIDWFSRSLSSSNPLLTPSRFITFQEDDDLLIDRYCAMLKKQNDGRVERLAILSEDETAYGAVSSQASIPDCFGRDSHGAYIGPLSLRYPRDIASLRSAYAQQMTSSAAQTSAQVSRGLVENLSEGDLKNRDTIRTYGGEQTPPSLDARLFELINALKWHRIHFILLRSSNVLDQIFLTSFFSRMDPDARVVLLRSDLMLSRGTGTQGFRGTMTLSTYPLLTAQSEWTRISERFRHTTFDDSDSQGIYMATRFLIYLQAKRSPQLASASLPVENPIELLQEYGPPWWSPENAPLSSPTWVSVLSQGQIWPVAVLESQGDSVRRAPNSIHSLVRTELNALKASQPQTLRLPMSTQVFFGFGFLWCLWHLYCCWSGSQTASPRCRTYFAPHRGPQHQSLILIGSLLLSLLAVVSLNLTRTTGLPSPLFEHAGWFPVYFWSLSGISLLAVLGNYLRAPLLMPPDDPGLASPFSSETRAESAASSGSWRKTLNRRTIEPWIRSRPWTRVLIDALLFIVVTILAERLFFFALVKPLDPVNQAFTIWRDVNLLSGVSPLTPLVLLVVGAYGWFWYTLMGLAHFNEDRARLPGKRDLDPALPMFSQEWLGDPIEKVAKPLGASYTAVLLPVLIGAIGFVFVVAAYTYSNDFKVRSLASNRYGTLYAWCLFLFIAVILADTIQMLRIWTRLRKLLVFLDRLPLRRTLHALKGFTWGTTWKMSGSVFQNRYKVLSREFESFGHLRNELHHAVEEETLNSHPPCSLEKPPRLSEDFNARLQDCGIAMKDFADWYRENGQKSNVLNLSTMAHYQSELAKTAGAVSTAILIPQWQKERESLIQDVFESPSEGGAEKHEREFPPVPEFQREAEEFFIWPYLDFIQSVLGRMRTLAMGILCLFVAATISVVSYPFDPRPLLGGIFLAVFVLVGSTISFVYGSMHRDTTLSHITNTTPGQLGWGFWAKLVGLGIGPLLAVLSTLFPAITGLLTSLLQPGMQSMQ